MINCYFIPVVRHDAMIRRFLTWVLVPVLCFVTIFAGATPRHTGQRAVWLDLSLTREDVAPVLNQLVKSGVNEVLFNCPQPDTHAGRIATGAAVKAAKAKGLRAYIFFDALNPVASNGNGRAPDVIEYNMEGSCGPGSGGARLSPFSAAMRERIVSTIGAAGSWCSAADGIVVRCAFPVDALLGFSNVAREAYLDKAGIDPVDINFEPRNAAEAGVMSGWFQWRLDKVASLVSDMRKAYAKSSPGGTFAVLGYADWEHMSIIEQACTLEDWMTWAQRGYIDEVVMTAPDSAISLLPINQRSITARGPFTHPYSRSMLLPLRNGKEVLDPLDAVEKFQYLGVTNLMVKVSSKTDLPRAIDFYQHTLPLLGPALRGEATK